MKKKLLACALCLAMIATCAISFVACNSSDTPTPTTFEMPIGTRPNYESLFSSDEVSLLTRAVNGELSEDSAELKEAVMLLYNKANYSRINTPLSLVVQESDAGISMASVIMHAFNLRNGDKWYYQLATSVQPASDDPIAGALAAAAAAFAGYVKVAYTTGDGNYWFFAGKGSDYSCDCSIPTFPYAEIAIQERDNAFETPLTLDAFNNKLHVLSNSIHEISNMAFCAEIIADGATVTCENGVYKVNFEVNMDVENKSLLSTWYAKAYDDMAEGGQKLESYDYYRATLEVWDNGYAKSYKSESYRNAGMGSGGPCDNFSYIWNEDEITTLITQDKDIGEKDVTDVDSYLKFKENPNLVDTKTLGFFEIIGIVVGCIAFVVIAIVVTIELLVKYGKLPKLAAKRQAKKDKRLAKKCAKQGITMADEEVEIQLVEEDDNVEIQPVEEDAAGENGQIGDNK